MSSQPGQGSSYFSPVFFYHFRLAYSGFEHGPGKPSPIAKGLVGSDQQGAAFVAKAASARKYRRETLPR